MSSSVCGSVWQCVVVHGNVCGSVLVCGSAWYFVL